MYRDGAACLENRSGASRLGFESSAFRLGLMCAWRVNVRGGQSVWKAARRVALTFESSALRYRNVNIWKVSVGGSDGVSAKHGARLDTGSGSNPAPSAPELFASVRRVNA